MSQICVYKENKVVYTVSSIKSLKFKLLNICKSKGLSNYSAWLNNLNYCCFSCGDEIFYIKDKYIIQKISKEYI